MNTQTMNTRREFLSMAAAAGAVMSAHAKPARIVPSADVKFRSALLHLGFNMWGGYVTPDEPRERGIHYTRTKCPTDPAVWSDITALMQKRRYNMAIIDLGGGVEFPSHPELTIKGCRSPQWMRDEVRRLADMGIEAIPKLNFSASHDAWLGIYERMVATPAYYQVVKDVIADAVEMFGNPRFIHIGMDEESMEFQRDYPVTMVRRGEVLWRDLRYIIDCVEKHNARAIMFGQSHFARNETEFYKRIPKTVVQNAGMYGHGHTLEWAKKKYEESKADSKGRPGMWKIRCMTLDGMFRRMGEHGYDVLSCSSNWVLIDKKKYPVVKYGKDYPQDRESIAWLHDLLAKEVAPERLIGGMTAPWMQMTSEYQEYWRDGINQLADAMDSHGWKS